MLPSVRKADPSDGETIKIILNEALERKRSFGDDSWGEVPFSSEEITELFATGTMLVAEYNNQIVGCLQFTESDTATWSQKGSDNAALYIHRLSKGLHQGGVRHIGSSLIEKVSVYARKANKAYVRLDCPTQNTGLCTYYEALGFHRVGTSPNGKSALYQHTLPVVN